MNRRERRKAAAQLRAKQVKGVLVLDRGKLYPGACDLCKKSVDDLRPYGPKGEWICFDCGQKDEKTTIARMRHVVYGESTH